MNVLACLREKESPTVESFWLKAYVNRSRWQLRAPKHLPAIDELFGSDQSEEAYQSTRSPTPARRQPPGPFRRYPKWFLVSVRR